MKDIEITETVIISPVFSKSVTPNNKWKGNILSPARTYNKNTTLDSPTKYMNVHGPPDTKDVNKQKEKGYFIFTFLIELS